MPYRPPPFVGSWSKGGEVYSQTPPPFIGSLPNCAGTIGAVSDKRKTKKTIRGKGYVIRNDNAKVKRQFFMEDKSKGLTQAGMARLNQAIEALALKSMSDHQSRVKEEAQRRLSVSSSFWLRLPSKSLTFQRASRDFHSRSMRQKSGWISQFAPGLSA